MTVFSKSVTTQIWLMGYEMTDTVIGFTKQKMVVITSKTKAEFLRPIIDGAKVQTRSNLYKPIKTQKKLKNL